METTPHMRSGDTGRSTRRTRRQQRAMATHNNTDSMNDAGTAVTPPQRAKQKKPLNFAQAMSDFQTMFPHIDKGVIEAVLRANEGVVQTTIDQLLVLSETTAQEDVTDAPRLPDYNECQRSEFADEPPPAYSEFENNGLIDLGKPNPPHPQDSNPVRPRNDSLFQTEREERLGFWKHPMIGTLPADFLRLQPDSEIATQTQAAQSSSMDGFLTDSEVEQFLEDQKLAMFLQNEEFIRTLRRDPDFITSLEEGNMTLIDACSSIFSVRHGISQSHLCMVQLHNVLGLI